MTLCSLLCFDRSRARVPALQQGATWKVVMDFSATSSVTDDQGNTTDVTNTAHAEMIFRLVMCTPGERLTFTNEVSRNTGGARSACGVPCFSWSCFPGSRCRAAYPRRAPTCGRESVHIRSGLPAAAV